ncbi:MAG: hypothetical protein LUC91_09330 [Prevotella sp.]|nr:hypothetical protein [Prevotella sp.]
MKNKFYIVLMMLVSVVCLLPSCSDDDEVLDDEYSSDRLFMPMFRRQQNTNNSSDRYACGIASEATDCPSDRVNDVMLYWYGVDGASGYQLRSKIQGTDWENNKILDTIVKPEVLEFLDEDLQYSVGYSYAIRAISPLGDQYNSKWYGYGDTSHQNDYMVITTGDRYDVPDVFWVEDVDYSTMRVYFNAEAESGYETAYEEFIDNGAEIDEDGNWVFDEITVTPTSDNPDLPTLTHTMTAQDFANGYVDFDGLVTNGSYIITGRNNNIKRVYDRDYNKTYVRMKGDVGDPITIEPIYNYENDTILTQSYVPNLKAARIDTVLVNYINDNTMAEGQVFYLRGGEYYYICNNMNMCKGFTLETDPADLAAGKGRAFVYLGVGTTTAAGTEGNAKNFNLGRNAASTAENGCLLTFQAIKFNEINFAPQVYYNYMDQTGIDGNSQYTIAANYFINMNSQGLGFTMSELSVTNCTFAGLVRGFIRFQGPNRQIIQKLTVDNCVFYDCGQYDVNGRGYSWFAGPGTNKNSNFYQNLTITNNSFLDCSRHALVTENGNLAWPEGTVWNIDIENNTFVNFAPRSSSSSHGLVLEIRYAPKNSTVTVKKNLFVQVRDGDDDDRNLYMRGMRIDTKVMNYDFADNYATTVPDWTETTLTDGLFTNYAFSNTSDGAGYQSGALNKGGYGETQIKFGDNVNGNEDDAVGYQLTPEELFVDPDPLAKNGYKDMHRHNVDGFYFQNTDKVKNHPIYTKGIGDPRWRTGAAWK